MRSLLRKVYRCEDAAKALLSAPERPLTPWTRFLLRIHLILCGPCRNYDAQLATLGRAAKKLSEKGDETALAREASIDDDARARIRERLRATAAEPPR